MIEHISTFLHSWAQNTSSPFIMVILLGVIFALDPCLMLTNIAAIGYIGKQVDSKRSSLIRGLYYTIGRTLSYGFLGVALIGILKTGGNVEPVEHFFDHWGSIIIIIFLLLSGIVLLVSDSLPALKNPVSNLNFQKFQGNLGAFLLGVILTLSFCPTNAVLFFGMMVPYCTLSSFGYVLPFVFALIPAIPVILISYLIAFSLNKIGSYCDKVKQIAKWTKITVAVLFILIGLFLSIEHISGHEHHHHHHHDDCESVEHHHHHHE